MMNYTLTQSAPVITECKDTSERIDLYVQYGLYIKPIARINITIALSLARMPGQAPPYAEILDMLRKQVQPEYDFTHLRVIKATLEFIRCEAEIENKSNLKVILSKLDGSMLRVPSYMDVLKVRAAEAKIAYPVRHDWETFYGNSEQTSDHWEKPDTVHLNDMPIKCFAARGGDPTRPSVSVLREVFSIFGEIKMVDIPMLSSSSSSLSTNPETFEAFIQYKDYFSFVKAMDTFRGMKLLYADPNEAYTANIKVDFDRTRHLSDKERKKREIDKLKAIEMEKIRNAQMEKEKEKENKQKEIANFRAMLEMATGDPESKMDEKSKEQRRREREEIRRQKLLAKKQQEEEKKLEQKIALEERKILIAQRKLESMRLLEELFNRVKVVVAQEEMEKREKELSVEREKRLVEEANLEQAKRMKIEQEEAELNEKIRRNLEKQEQEMKEAQRMAEEGEFELRKNVDSLSPNSQLRNNGSSSTTQIPVPRQIILTQQQQSSPFHQTNTTPKLYDDDDDDNSNSNAPKHSVRTPSEHQDTNSNQEMTTTNTSGGDSNLQAHDDDHHKSIENTQTVTD